jgi:1,4-alpha-glucan branching enzyme
MDSDTRVEVVTAMVETTGDSNGQVLTTFRLPNVVVADQACVVGDFNDWSHTANPMEREHDEFVVRIALSPGKAYRFRYLLDGDRWENDWAADAYARNEFGGDDSVIDLTNGHRPMSTDDERATPKTRVRKRTAEETR